MNGENSSQPPSRRSGKPGSPKPGFESGSRPSARPDVEDPRSPQDRQRVQTADFPVTTSALSGAPPSSWEGPAVGMLIDNAYRVIGPLGQGGMGVVVLAFDEKLERDVAIKFIRPAYATQNQVRERFLNEARAMARIRHDNVVEIHAFGELEGVPYFVMEYVAGSSVAFWLQDAMCSAGPPRLDEALGLLDQICRGLSAIHASGTVHGDLKPTNVLIGTAFRAAIADLGMSRVLAGNGSPDERALAGTPAYMAPEVVRGDAPPGLEQRSDIYSLGVMAFEMLTAEAPYDVKSIEDLLALQAQTATRPSQIRHDITEQFDEVILQALHTDPEKRTADADRFRVELLRARESMGALCPAQRILIANRDPTFCVQALATLEQAFPGTAVECVNNGEEALKVLEREPAELAVVGLELPGMNGLELAATLRGTETSRAMPIIVVSSSGYALEWKLLSSLGVDGFLVEPLDPYALAQLARKILGVAVAQSRCESSPKGW